MMPEPSPDLVRRLLFAMKRIRCVEETIAARYDECQMRCPVHLSVGQEAVAAAVGAVLRQDDLAVSGHRAHAHYLAKGGDLPAMIAELYGKATGCSRGKGGSMHLVDDAAGFMGSTAIVGGTVPVGVGLAYGMRLKRTDQVSCIFIGDAVAETGVFFESVNFAVLKRLPVLFVCENNLYGEYSPLATTTPVTELADRADSYAMAKERVDGNDVWAMHTATLGAVERARAGEGPTLIEALTYRQRGHSRSDPGAYRPAEEVKAWLERDPIALCEQALVQAGVDAAKLDGVRTDAQARVKDALERAHSWPDPEPTERFEDVWA
jgi:TPP-dependent pyruvate/acetoin dehydrogenase alpha subunit